MEVLVCDESGGGGWAAAVVVAALLEERLRATVMEVIMCKRVRVLAWVTGSTSGMWRERHSPSSIEILVDFV